jgi:hypothetical protein
MKKQSTAAISKRAVTLTLAAFLLFGFTSNANVLPDSATPKGPEIAYQGLQDKNLVFNVNYNNETGEPSQLMVKNEENVILYFKEYKDKLVNTKILFTDVPENCKLTFSIKTGKKEVSHAFEINTQIKTVEEFVVKGL